MSALHVPGPIVPRPSTSAPRWWSREILGAAYDRLDRHNGDGLAAGLAFGALLSLAPLLLVVLGITSAFLGEGHARAQLEHLVGDSLGARAVSLVDQLIRDARAWSGTATVVGVVLFIVGSARLASLVDGAFRLVFGAPADATRPTLLEQVRVYLATQLKSLGVTLGAGLLMVASMVLRALGESLFSGVHSTGIGAVWAIGRELVSFAVWLLALALVYWALPRVRLDRGAILHGALVSALLVEATLLVLRVSASFFDFGAAYGAAGAIVGTLVTLYVVSQLFLFGAELTAELAARRRNAGTPPALPGA